MSTRTPADVVNLFTGGRHEGRRPPGGGSEPPMDDTSFLELNNRVTHIEATMATRGDIAELKTSLAEISAKLDISSIREAVEKSHTDIYKWVATIAISVAGLGFAVYSGLKQQTAPSAPQIIQVPVPIQVAPTTTPKH